MTSRLSTFPNELVTSSFTASNIPASNLPASDFPASNFPIDLVIVVWSILDYFVRGTHRLDFRRLPGPGSFSRTAAGNRA